jgi:DNA-directed RNA polymerase specialized sigma24 family protein
MQSHVLLDGPWRCVEGVAAQSQKDREPSPTGFHLLLTCLDVDSETAGMKYENLRIKLVKYFERRSFSAADEAADTVVNRVTHRLAEGEQVANVCAYALGVARYYALELGRGPEFVTSGSEDDQEDGRPDFIENLRAPEPTEDDPQAQAKEARLVQLDGCLEGLPEPKRKLILWYFETEGPDKIEERERLAERLGLTRLALRIQVSRARRKIEECLGVLRRAKNRREKTGKVAG